MRVGKTVVQIRWEAVSAILSEGVVPVWIGQQILGIITGGPLA